MIEQTTDDDNDPHYYFVVGRQGKGILSILKSPYRVILRITCVTTSMMLIA